MTLKEFIENFVCKNTLVRLWYQVKGGHEMVIKTGTSVSMEWNIIRGEGIYKNFIDYKVIGVTDIVVSGNYAEAVNIVIERINIDDLRDKRIEKLGL